MSDKISKDDYSEYAELIGELVSAEQNLQNLKRAAEQLKSDLSHERHNGKFGVEFTGHAYKMASERIEEICMQSPMVFNDVFKNDSPMDLLLLPSNLKSFVITLISYSYNNGEYTEEESRNTPGGREYKYTTNIKKWSHERSLQFVAIVENSHIKTVYFNWI